MPDISELEIPDIVQDYLEPLLGNSPVGIDASNEEEYFVLNMEIPKTTPDYKKCIELSAVILKEKSKDIKISTWLCFALFRTEKIKGLVNGLKIIYHLLKKYENNLYPTNPNYRSKAIQFLNQPRFYKLVEKEIVNNSNAKDFIEADIVLNAIIAECSKLFPENVPVLKFIVEAMQTHVENAKDLLAPPKEKTPIPQVQNQLEKKVEIIEKPVVETAAPPKVADKPIQQTVPVKEPVQPIKLGSENDGIIQLRQILTQFYEYQADGNKKEKVPESYFVFGIVRQLQWGKIFRPQETDGITQLEAPNSIMQTNIKKWYETSDWDTLIPRIEINFLKADSAFPYWLDAQRFVVKALEQKGGNYTLAAEEIKRQLVQLINRISDIHQLKFKDKQTPLADDETVKWIYDEVMSSASKGESKDQIILPPIMGEDYEQITLDYKQACMELPKNIETNITSMQKAINSDERRKGKFLRRLNLANYCMQAKIYDLAKVHLTELNSLIDEYNIELWEPALCTSVWQSMYMVNKEIISKMKDKELKLSLENQQTELFNKVAKYDSITAIKLKQKKER
jgi:type VI secretion system protein VasJ